MRPKPATEAAPVAVVDWSHPWYAPWRDNGQRIEGRVRAGEPLCEALNQAGSAPVRFVAHTALPSAMAYEAFIAQTRDCPTRQGLHDFFNALCWIGFPRTKTRLNALQAQQLRLSGVQSVRGAVRDALTLFDENAAFLRAPDALWDALIAKQWGRLFDELRPLWQDAQLLLFGHALLEKLQSPRKAITAHVYRVSPKGDDLGDWDRWVAQDLDCNKLAAKPFAHLPVLGVPGWWAANADPGFYRDPAVFRPARTVEAAKQ
ncbi:MAG: DUF3025 domain-containing protein [Betaproteobacteria bacterium]|nr:DUF3025 domain-containing protein [Betaproteobacteria bacterium]